jgi:2-amino-4-hydroxy-6-hydroxymethyldihydropteridine diphosphokinase
VARAFVGLGSNLGDREGTLRAAVGRLRGLAGTEVRGVSALRDSLLALERAFGRDRSASTPHGPRTLDLDLLLYEEQEIAEPGLEVPHPRLHERRFVLEPLAQLDPALEVPKRGSVQTLLSRLDSAP